MCLCVLWQVPQSTETVRLRSHLGGDKRCHGQPGAEAQPVFLGGHSLGRARSISGKCGSHGYLDTGKEGALDTISVSAVMQCR